MVKLFRWLLGYVGFTFSGGFNDGFINSCYEQKINIQKLRENGGALYGECLANQYIKLRTIAKENGGRLCVTKKHGLIFPFLKLKNRWGLFVGALLFICIVSFLSGFIWNVEITGNEKISNAEITSFLEENGLHEGVLWKNTDKSKIENLMMASFDDIAWVQINELGTTAKIEINETVEKPKITSKKITNVKAKKDGLIVKTSVTNGWQVAKKGDSVTKGDLLISGIYESEMKKGNQFTHASGEYIAEVKEPFLLRVARKQSYKIYRGERLFRKLSIFGIKIPLYFASYDEKNSVIKTKSEYIKLNNKKLPIGIITICEKKYDVEARTLSDSELQSLCEEQIKKRLEEDYSDYEILKKDISVSLGADEAQAKGEIICLEDIGEEVPIKIHYAQGK